MSENQAAGQSPPPERQDPKQQREPPSDGKGVNPESKSKQDSENQLEGLKSNPDGPLDAHAEEISKKKYKNIAGELHEL